MDSGLGRPNSMGFFFGGGTGSWVSLAFFLFFFFCFLKSIYLAALGLSCGTQDLQSSLQDVGSFSCGMQDL